MLPFGLSLSKSDSKSSERSDSSELSDSSDLIFKSSDLKVNDVASQVILSTPRVAPAFQTDPLMEGQSLPVSCDDILANLKAHALNRDKVFRNAHPELFEIRNKEFSSNALNYTKMALNLLATNEAQSKSTAFRIIQEVLEQDIYQKLDGELFKLFKERSVKAYIFEEIIDFFKKEMESTAALINGKPSETNENWKVLFREDSKDWRIKLFRVIQTGYLDQTGIFKHIKNKIFKIDDKPMEMAALCVSGFITILRSMKKKSPRTKKEVTYPYKLSVNMMGIYRAIYHTFIQTFKTNGKPRQDMARFFLTQLVFLRSVTPFITSLYFNAGGELIKSDKYVFKIIKEGLKEEVTTESSVVRLAFKKFAAKLEKKLFIPHPLETAASGQHSPTISRSPSLMHIRRT